MLKICPVNYVSGFGGVFPPTLTCRMIHTRKQKLPLLYLKLASYLYIKDNTNDFKDSEIMQRNKKKIKKKDMLRWGINYRMEKIYVWMPSGT